VLLSLAMYAEAHPQDFDNITAVMRNYIIEGLPFLFFFSLFSSFLNSFH
jgi:hypothetical protein